VAAVALEEFFGLITARGLDHPGRWFLLVGAAVTWSFVNGAEWILASLVFAVILLMAVSTATGPVRSSLERTTAGAAGVVYTCLLLGFLILLSRPEVFVLLGIVWMGDTAAYYGGRLLGRHRLAPEISPNKTVEGAVAGAIGSVVLGAALGSTFLGLSVQWLIVVSLVTALVAQVGDLVESALKRGAEVKDSSSILPGHGGILDRIDSLLFAAPIFYSLLRI
jgi:phosphatidate cytidylyltransferase